MQNIKRLCGRTSLDNAERNPFAPPKCLRAMVGQIEEWNRIIAYLLELLDCPFINTAALVDQVT